MPLSEAIKKDREAYPIKRAQVHRMLGQWREAPGEKKSEIAGRILTLVKVQFKCRLNDLSNDPDFSKEFTPDVVSGITKDAQ